MARRATESKDHASDYSREIDAFRSERAAFTERIESIKQKAKRWMHLTNGMIEVLRKITMYESHLNKLALDNKRETVDETICSADDNFEALIICEVIHPGIRNLQNRHDCINREFYEICTEYQKLLRDSIGAISDNSGRLFIIAHEITNVLEISKTYSDVLRLYNATCENKYQLKDCIGKVSE